MNPSQSQRYLDSFINYEHSLDSINQKEFRLERMRKLLDALDNPQKDLKIIHVAGSKGKGSVSVMIAHILKAAGYRVGLYTSPHINDRRERIRILGRNRITEKSDDLFNDMITDEELNPLIDYVKGIIDSAQDIKGLGRLSFFEVYTAIALCYFKRNHADAVVLEAGLGGRLDATNAADSIMAAITPISLEHTHLLGNTLEEIAQEKSAIIKRPGQKAIVGPQEEAVIDAIDQRCKKFGVKPLYSQCCVSVRPIKQMDNGQVLNISTGKMEIKNAQLLLAGAHQRDNCAMAVCAAEELGRIGFIIDQQNIKEGIEHVFWPLRFEVVRKKPLVIVDGAHNLKSVELLMSQVQSIRGNRRLKIIYGTSRDKEYGDIISKLREFADDLSFVKSDHPRAADLPGAVKIREAANGIANDEQALTIITGSMFVAAEARRHILGHKLCIN